MRSLVGPVPPPPGVPGACGEGDERDSSDSGQRHMIGAGRTRNMWEFCYAANGLRRRGFIAVVHEDVRHAVGVPATRFVAADEEAT